MNNSIVKHLTLISVLCFLVSGCATIKYQPKTDAEVVPTENRIDRTVFIEEFQIITTDGEKKVKTHKTFGADLASGIREYLHISQLFSDVRADSNSADLYIKGYVKNLKTQHKGKKYLSLSTTSYVATAVVTTAAAMILSNQEDPNNISNSSLVTAAGLTTVGLVGTFSYIYYFFKWRNRAEFIQTYDITLDFLDKDGTLLKSYTTNYELSYRPKDKLRVLQEKLNNSFEDSFSNLKEAIIADSETLLNSKN